MEDPDSGTLADQLGVLPVFADLGPSTLEALGQRATLRAYQSGAALIREGDQGVGLFVLQRGRAKAVKTSLQGREQTLALLGPGQAVNAVAVFAGHPSPATVIALEPTDALVVPRAVALELVRANPDFAQRVIEEMAGHMVRLVDMVADLTLRSVLQRLSSLLLAEANDGVILRARWHTHPELAARLGTVADVVQRALGRLEADGVITTDRREVRILDHDALRRAAG